MKCVVVKLLYFISFHFASRTTIQECCKGQAEGLIAGEEQRPDYIEACSVGVQGMEL